MWSTWANIQSKIFPPVVKGGQVLTVLLSSLLLHSQNYPNQATVTGKYNIKKKKLRSFCKMLFGRLRGYDFLDTSSNYRNNFLSRRYIILGTSYLYFRVSYTKRIKRNASYRITLLSINRLSVTTLYYCNY